jgi:thioredoxin 1
MSENMITVTDSSFEAEVLQANTLVLVDFWAEWCGPCKMLAPILETIAEEFAGKVKFAKVNVDENNIALAGYDIRGIPTLILFKDGEIVATKVGMISKAQLVDFINTNLTV